jgi:hypothetical protein
MESTGSLARRLSIVAKGDVWKSAIDATRLMILTVGDAAKWWACHGRWSIC